MGLDHGCSFRSLGFDLTCTSPDRRNACVTPYALARAGSLLLGSSAPRGRLPDCYAACVKWPEAIRCRELVLWRDAARFRAARARPVVTRILPGRIKGPNRIQSRPPRRPRRSAACQPAAHRDFGGARGLTGGASRSALSMMSNERG